MIGRGSRLSRKKQRTIQRVGKEQYTEWAKAGKEFTPCAIRCMENKLNSMADEKASKKRHGKRIIESHKRMLRNRLDFANTKPVVAPTPMKFFSAGSDDPEAGNARRKKRRDADAMFQPIPKSKKGPQ